MKYLLALLFLCVSIPNTFSQHIEKDYSKSGIPVLSQPVIKRITATEICNNLIDDDNNGLIDENDFSCYFNGITPGNCKNSSIVWGTGGLGELVWIDLSTGAQHEVGRTPLGMVDISWAANGKLYGSSLGGIWEIDPNTAGIQSIGNVLGPYTSGNSLTADASGNLYFTSNIQALGDKIVKFNITTGVACVVADLAPYNVYPAGDLTFLNGMLYLTAAFNKIVRINIKTGEITVQRFTNSSTSSYYGLVSMPDGFLYVADRNAIYRVDPATMVVNTTPLLTWQNGPFGFLGLASYYELCQAPICTANTTIQPSTNPPFCIDIGVRLQASVTQCGSNIANIYWTTPNAANVPGNTVKAITPGKYYLNYQTATETCSQADSFILQYSGNMPLQIDTSYQLPNNCTCTGTMTVIAGCGSGNFKYEWSNGAATATVTNVCPGMYFVKVTDIDWHQDTTIYYNMLSPNSIKRLDKTVTDEHCSLVDGSITITQVVGGIPPYQYAINNQPFVTNSVFSSLSAGSYSIMVKDNTGCSFQQLVVIQAIPGPEKLWYTQKDAYCGLPGGTIFIDSVKGGSAPYSFTVDNGIFTPQKVLTDILPGQRLVTVKDYFGCLASISLTIQQSEQLHIAVSPKDTSICASETVPFRAALLSTNEGVKYYWDQQPPTPANTFNKAIFSNSKIIVQAIDKNGCMAFDTATIAARYCDSLFAKCVRFPNAFTPNKDGRNDTFGPHEGSCEIKSYRLTIYNRWGQMLFQSSNLSQKWDGNVNGQSQQNGTFIYYCMWVDALGYVHKQKGAIELIR